MNQKSIDNKITDICIKISEKRLKKEDLLDVFFTFREPLIYKDMSQNISNELDDFYEYAKDITSINSVQHLAFYHLNTPYGNITPLQIYKEDPSKFITTRDYYTFVNIGILFAIYSVKADDSKRRTSIFPVLTRVKSILRKMKNHKSDFLSLDDLEQLFAICCSICFDGLKKSNLLENDREIFRKNYDDLIKMN